MKISLLRVAVWAIAAFTAASAQACTEFYVGKDVSADGTVMIARTVDSPPWNGSHRCEVTPRVENAPGRVFRCPGSGFEWPLPATTWKMVSTPRLASIQKDRASACANERGFVLTGTVTAHPRGEWLELDPYNRESGPGEDTLPALVGLTCANCREALDLFERVIAEKGHDGGEIYTFADKDEAWLIEVYTGHQWAAVKLPPDKVSVFGNQFMIGSFDPASPDVRMSKDLLKLPESKGKLVRGEDGLPDLYATYSGPLRDYANYRTWFAHEALAAEPLGAYRTSLRVPFLFAPKGKVSLKDLFALSRTRYEGTDWNPEENNRPEVRTIGTTKQMTCHVLQLDPKLPPASAGTVWVALGNAEHVPYLPMNASVTDLDPSFAADQEEKPYRFDVRLAGHAFRRLAALAEQNRIWYGKGVRDHWEKFEDRLLAEYPKQLAHAARSGEPVGTSALTSWTMREQRRAYEDAKRIFDDLMWYVMANNRISGDGSGATDKPEKPFAVSRLARVHTFSVITYNVRHGAGNDGKVDLARQAALINAEKPRFVLLQELDQYNARSGFLDEQAVYGKLTGMYPVFGRTLGREGHESYGIGLLSREPPVREERIEIPDSREKRMILICEFPDCYVGSTHFSVASDEDRKRALGLLRKRLADGFDKPFLLGGDFNADPDSEIVAELKKDFEILTPVGEPTYIGKSKTPLTDRNRSIDYIMVDKAHAAAFEVVRTAVLGENAADAPSDHRPLVVTLRPRSSRFKARACPLK